MKFEAEAKEDKDKGERRVNVNDLPPYKLFIGEASLNLGRRYKNSRGPWLVVVTPSGKKALINLSNDRSISESLIVGSYWILPRTNQYLIDPVEAEGAVIRVPQKYLDLLK